MAGGAWQEGHGRRGMAGGAWQEGPHPEEQEVPGGAVRVPRHPRPAAPHVHSVGLGVLATGGAEVEERGPGDVEAPGVSGVGVALGRIAGDACGGWWVVCVGGGGVMRWERGGRGREAWTVARVGPR
jgi:hypothetical protein